MAQYIQDDEGNNKVILSEEEYQYRLKQKEKKEKESNYLWKFLSFLSFVGTLLVLLWIDSD